MNQRHYARSTGPAAARMCVGSARTAALFAVILAGATARVIGQEGAAPPPQVPQDWLRLVPGDARFYVEIRDLVAIRQLFRALGIWELTRELAAASAPSAATQPWQRSAEALLGLDPDTAISEILGRKVALFASESSQWQNGVLLAELPRPDDLGSLLKRWGAGAPDSDGPVRTYLLRGGIRLASRDRVIVLGAAGDPEGLWGRCVGLLSGRRGPNLAARSEVAALRMRLSREYPALMYVAWAEDDPTAVAGCKRLMIGADVSPHEVISEWRGQLVARKETPVAKIIGGDLPVSTIAAYASAADFADVSRKAGDRHFELTGSLLDFLAGSLAGIDQNNGKLLPRLGPAYSIALSGRREATSVLEWPDLALSVSLRPESGGADRFESFMSVFTQILLAIAGGPAAGGELGEAAIRRKTVAGVDIRSVDLGGALSRRLKLDVLAGLQICWGAAGDRIIVSSSVEQAEQVVKALRGEGPRLADEAAATAADFPAERRAEGPVVEWAFVRGVALARMLTSWTEYLRLRSPEMLSASWWRAWAARRVDQRTRLGVSLETSRTDARYAVVREISSGSPASETLREGDVIVAVGGKPLTTTRPAGEIAERYRARGASSRFELRVLREGELIDVAVPVSPADPIDLREFDPVRAINQLIILTRRIESLTLHRYAIKPDRLDAHLRVRWVQRPPT